MRHPLAALLVALALLPALPALSADVYTPSIHDPASPLIAKAKKKKKKKPAEEDDFGPPDIKAADDNDNGVGIHREQIGVDTPYKAEAGGAGDIAFLNRKSGSADPQSATNIDINVRILFILGHAAIGGELGLLYDATKATTTTTDATGKATTDTAQTSTTGVSLTPMFKWNFTDINHSLTVPFAYAGAGFGLEQKKVGDADPAKSTGPIIKAGAGLNMFLTGFAAINPAVEYRIKTLKPTTGDQTTESGIHLLGGFTLFL